MVHRLIAASSGLAVVGAATLGYGVAVERRRYRLRRITVPVLPPGRDPLRLLHLSDLHLTAGQRDKAAWVRDLATLTPDLVVATGDFLADRAAVPEVLAAHRPLAAAFPGFFVPGNNDYFAPVPRNPFSYLLPDRRRRRVYGQPLPWDLVRDGLAAAGWTDLTHQRTTLVLRDSTIEVAGVDDAHLRRDRYRLVGGPVAPPVDLAIGVMHTPEPRLLDDFTGDGFRLLLAGHTHGGQVRLPGLGAVVTNCGLDRARARGLSRHGEAWLHVSAGLGTSPYAPVRLGCPPEATLLTLVAGRPGPGGYS